MTVGKVANGVSLQLNPNASNLAEVLSNLQARPSLARRYNDLVRQVFPHVSQVSASQEANGQVQVMVWAEGSDTDRIDLAIPIADSGSGVFQVLAILYVALTSEYPQVIVIDEPQSFLHRGACRSLMNILRNHFGQHQFIVATHSPTVISALRPSSILMIGQHDGESTISQLDPTAVEHQRLVLNEVGATLADVYGAEHIFWVEGATEAECFPLIASHFSEIAVAGTVFRSLRATGDLLGRQGKLVFEIYESLSEGGAVIPPAIAFEFDGDKWTSQRLPSTPQLRELPPQSGGGGGDSCGTSRVPEYSRNGRIRSTLF